MEFHTEVEKLRNIDITNSSASEMLKSSFELILNSAKNVSMTCETINKNNATVNKTCSEASSLVSSEIKSNSIIGGKWSSEYQLFCKSIPSDGVIKTAIKHFSGNNYVSLPNEPVRVSEIDIRFKPDSFETSTDLSAVYVGEEFYMFIRYRGDSKYTVVPENCTAYPGRSTQSDGTVIWDSTTCSKHFDGGELMENFNISEPVAVAKLYGFHFMGNSDITIQCTVRICKDAGKCHKKTDKCFTVNNRRKRRSISSHQKRNVKGSIRVYDAKSDLKSELNGATSVVKGPLCIVPAVLVIVRNMLF